MLQSLYCETKERNVQNYFLVNDQGSTIKIERGRTYCWIELDSTTKHIQWGFTVDDFDNDRIQFNKAIDDIINDCFKDNYYNLF